MNKMIYNFSEHGLYYENGNERYTTIAMFSVVLGDLTPELEYDLNNGKLLGISGYLPLVKATRGEIILKNWEEENVYIKNFNANHYEKGAVYDISSVMSDSKKYFEPFNINYDSERGIIQIGEKIEGSLKFVKINSNLYCQIDSEQNISCLLIVPDKFIENEI